MKRTVAALLGVTLGVCLLQRPLTAQRATTVNVLATNIADIRAWDSYVNTSTREGTLRLRRADVDPALPARTLQRFQQFYQGVPVWGADIVRDSASGVPESVFGSLADGIQVDTAPRIGADAATAAMQRAAGDAAVALKQTELVVLPTPTGFRLAYTNVVSTQSSVVRLFVDANDGSEIKRYSALETQAAVGTGIGVLGDKKKISVLQVGSLFLADDQLRPPVLRTLDMHGSLTRFIQVFLEDAPTSTGDIASDTDNFWTDPAAVDAHVHVAWTYDYYYKRFGRHGLDNANRPVLIIVNPVTQQGALTDPVAFGLALNAAWCGECGPGGIGAIYFGDGIPPGYYSLATGRNYTYFSGALDIAAHELTHGVTDSSSQLIYMNESGALNEAFSDMMGKSVEFFYHPAGSAPGQADYTLGKDISRAVLPGALNGDRSMADPGLYGDPDHYSKRYTGTDDNGGVHTNSGIANQAFYLAIEGGTNRTSGLTVQGVGATNREQIEKVFYRALVFLMPANSTFSTARAATIQAARDLYGIGSGPERAVTQAWTAVGVF